MPEYKNDPLDDEPLDRLLAQARWPEPGARRIERLNAYWRQIHRRSAYGGAPRLALVALAAGMLLATGAACWRWVIAPESLGHPKDLGAPLLAIPSSQSVDRSPSSAPPQATKSHWIEPQTEEPDWVRSPSRYEQVMLLAATSKSRTTKAESAVAVSQIAVDRPSPDSVKHEPGGQQSHWAELLRRGDAESICRYLSAVERGDRAALAAAGGVEHPPIDLLFGCLEGPLVERRLAAAMVLGNIDEPEVSRRLGRCVCENISRQEALVGLLARKDVLAKEFVGQARENINLTAVVAAAQWQLDSLNTDNWR